MIKALKNKLICSRFTIIPIVCFLVVLTYVDFFPDIIRYNLSYIVWPLVLAECLIARKIRIKKQAIYYIAYGMIFIAVLAVFQLASGKAYLSSSTVYAILVALLVFICGVLLGNKLNVSDVEVICRWYTIGAILLAVMLVINTRGDFGIQSRVYQGINKNSVGQIISTAATILMIGISAKKERSNTIIRIILSGFLIVILFLIRSRTCILCFIASIIVMLFSRYTNKKVKFWILISFLAVLAIVLANARFRNMLITNILFANRDATSLDALSSGRVSIYSQFFPLLRGNELFGSGARYYESFYLSVIIQFGIPVGLYLWGYVAYMLGLIRKMNRYLPYGWLLVIISISYSLNGVFEGLPPFGPGTKNFLLWLLFGMAIMHVDFNRTDPERQLK